MLYFATSVSTLVSLEGLLGLLAFIVPGFIAMQASSSISVAFSPEKIRKYNDKQVLAGMVIFSFVVYVSSISIGSLFSKGRGTSSLLSYSLEEIALGAREITLNFFLVMLLMAVALGSIWGFFRGAVFANVTQVLSDGLITIGRQGFSDESMQVAVGKYSDKYKWAEICLESGTVYRGYLTKYATPPDDLGYVLVDSAVTRDGVNKKFPLTSHIFIPAKAIVAVHLHGERDLVYADFRESPGIATTAQE